jgi:phosphoglucosamine mutase
MSGRRLFGTDGIRGTANLSPMDAPTALRLGQAAGRFFNRGGHRHRVVIGKDTQLSGYLLEPALTAGFVGAGMDVTLVGPIPTPAVAQMTRSLRCDLGVMLSASHNPYEDNGIKLFGPDGLKLSDAQEEAIETLMEADLASNLAHPSALGRVSRLEDARGRYVEAAKGSFPKGLALDGMRVALDCANGAAYRSAPTVLWELGAEVVPIGVSPDGTNINKDCGSTSPGQLVELVKRVRADVGVALDGDGDRLVVVADGGTVVDGDQILAPSRRPGSRTGAWQATPWSPRSCPTWGWKDSFPVSDWVSCAPPWATATSERPCGNADLTWAGSSPVTSSCRISAPPATAWSQLCRCWLCSPGPEADPARFSGASSPCRRSW